MEIIFEENRLEEAARSFIENIGSDCVFLFEGEMGSGKTTFIAEVCRQLGSEDAVGSPTFSVVNEYRDKNGNPLYHFDLYRLESLREVMDTGAEEYFESGELCFVEWPDRLGDYLPERTRKVRIEENEDGSRKISF